MILRIMVVLVLLLLMMVIMLMMAMVMVMVMVMARGPIPPVLTTPGDTRKRRESDRCAARRCARKSSMAMALDSVGPLWRKKRIQ
jgi:hypothetical protein